MNTYKDILISVFASFRGHNNFSATTGTYIPKSQKERLPKLEKRCRQKNDRFDYLTMVELLVYVSLLLQLTPHQTPNHESKLNLTESYWLELIFMCLIMFNLVLETVWNVAKSQNCRRGRIAWNIRGIVHSSWFKCCLSLFFLRAKFFLVQLAPFKKGG